MRACVLLFKTLIWFQWNKAVFVHLVIQEWNAISGSFFRIWIAVLLCYDLGVPKYSE